MRISDWSSDVCSSDLQWRLRSGPPSPPPIRSIEIFNAPAPPWTPPRLCALMLRPSLRDSFMARYSAFSLLANAFTGNRSEEHTSELQSLMRISYAVFCLKKKKTKQLTHTHITHYHKA